MELVGLCQQQILNHEKAAVNLLLTRHCFVQRRATNQSRFHRIELWGLNNGNCNLEE
jgi:hypothetical protein